MSEVEREFIAAAFGYRLKDVISEIDGVVLVSHWVVR
jgi:hypothetical protein